MRRTPNQTSPSEKTRYLNIVYFVESARSHTIRVNLTHARWAIGALAVVAVWAIGSVFWIINLQYQSAKTRDRLETALTTIFDYQIKNEKVFEQAYPPEATNGYYSELAQLPSNNPLSDHNSGKETPVATEHVAAVKQTPPASAPAKTETAPLTQRTVATEAKKNPETLPPPTSAPVSNKHADKANDKIKSETTVAATSLEISGAKLSKSENKIALTFNIQNKNSHRAEGFIWAVAMIAQENGQVKPIASPAYTKIDPNSGAVLSARSAYRFSILRFKTKEFDFKVPASSAWKLTKLTIHLTDLEGAHEQKVEVPVEHVAVSSIADTPSTDIKL